LPERGVEDAICCSEQQRKDISFVRSVCVVGILIVTFVDGLDGRRDIVFALGLEMWAGNNSVGEFIFRVVDRGGVA
jgi:hypothetical protein